MRGRLIHFCHSPGVALIVTLMMMSIMVMMVVGLAGVMRNEQAAARNLTYQVAAEQMADLGAREAMALVLSNSTSSIGFPTATGPGWMQVNGPAGTREVDLFSSNSAAQIKWLDRIGTNSLILSLPGAARGLIAACWTNVVTNGGNPNVPFGRYAWWVDDEGSKVNLNATGQNTNYLPFLNAFPIIGDWLFANPFTLVTNSASASRASALIARTNYLPTLESVKDTNLINPGISNSVYRQIKGGVTVWSSNVDLTPWGTAKLNLADLTNTTLYPNPKAGMLAVKSALATNAFTNFFPAGQNLARKYGGGSNSSTDLDNHGDLILQQIAANIMAAAGRPVTLTNGGDYFTPVGNNDARRHRNNLPRQVASHFIGPYLDQVRVRVDYRIQAQTNVEARLGIWVRVVNPYTNNFANWTLQVQPRKFIFGLCPPAGLYFSGDISPTDLNSSAPLNGYTGHSSYWINGQVWVGPNWEQAPDKLPPGQLKPWPLGRVFSTNIAVGSKSYLDAFFTNVISYTLVTTNVANLPPQVRYAYVMLDQVCLYEGGATPTSLRDWLTHDDLSRSNTPADKVFRTSLDVGQMDFSDVSGTGNGPLPIKVDSFAPLSTSDFASATSLGVRRIDPQVRYPLVFWDSSGTSPTNMGVMKSGGWSLIPRRGVVSGIPSAWSTNPTFNCTNTNGSVTGLAYLWPDPAPGVTDVTNHPHFVPGYRPTNGFRSVAQLGAIHTGIPWRTLRLQPQPSVEMAAANGATNSPPDWVLLDVFSATNSASARAMVSLNGYPRMYGGIATNEDGSISTRALSVASLLGAASKIPGSDNICTSNGIPTSLRSNSTVFTNIPGVAQNFTNVSTSPNQASVWPSAGAWGTYRQANSNNFPRNGFLLAGEILEVAGVAEDTSANPALGEDVLEGRLRSFMDLVTTRSDTFTVWSAGQGLVVNTNRGNRTNVMAEVRKQTVFQRIPMTNASGVTTNYSLKVLYTRNHVVE